MPNRIVQYPVPLILKDILQKKSSGELFVEGDNFRKILYFSEGNLIFAETNVLEERLGEILYKIRKIDQDQFGNIRNLIKNRNEKLGRLLIRDKVLNHRDVFFALLFQLRTIATSLFNLHSGEWDFLSKPPRVPEDSKFNIELPGIITEGIGKATNLSYYKNRFFNSTAVPKEIPDHLSEFLSAYEINLLKDLKSHGDVTMEKLIPVLKMPEEDFWRKIALFFLLDLAEFSEASGDVELDKNVEEVLALYDQLKTRTIDYYELFGIKNTATFNEIKNAYFSYAKRYHPDRISNAPDPEIKEKANFVFAEINKAYETLSNDDLRREYDTQGYKDAMESTIKENFVEKAKMLYRKGKALYSQRKYWEAVTILEEAVRADGTKAAYYLLLGLCQMNLPQMRRMAERNLQKVVDLENWNVEAHVAMGMLFLSEHQLNRADGFFRKALSLNPDHALARKKIDEIRGISKSDKKKSGFSLFGKAKK